MNADPLKCSEMLRSSLSALGKPMNGEKDSKSDKRWN